MMTQTLLIALDLSENTDQVVEAARATLKLQPTRILLTHVVPTAEISLPTMAPGGTGHPSVQVGEASVMALHQREEAAHSRLQEIAEKLDARAEVNIFVRHGRPSAQICYVAELEKADLILLASHGHGFLHRVVLGSTAQQVINNANCHVLVLRPSALAAVAQQPAEPLHSVQPGESETVPRRPAIPSAAGCVA